VNIDARRVGDDARHADLDEGYIGGDTRDT
jgi:hypothetical protein